MTFPEPYCLLIGMRIGAHQPASVVSETDGLLAGLRARLPGRVGEEIDIWRSHAAAFLFHLEGARERPLLVPVLGGTGSGKSTLVNRLIGREICATSYRRTFTTGPVAITADGARVPRAWLRLEHRRTDESDLPVRGDKSCLTVVSLADPLTARLTLVDTPDLDGDHPDHHALADLVFRWSEALLFVVTPEKYQMTELPGYYRLAARYALPALFVMNKCEEAAVLDDFREQLVERGWPEANVFALPRDDSSYTAPAGLDLHALKTALTELTPPAATDRRRGLAERGGDLLDRLQDKILSPLKETRDEVDRVQTALRSLRTTGPGVDVAPLTEHLRRNLQQQSILYLMGPGRMFERLRQMPGLIARMPRTVWDVIVRGEKLDTAARAGSSAEKSAAHPPDYASILSDQLVVLQSRIEDILRSSQMVEHWIEEESESWAETRLDPQDAACIADEELDQLRQWLAEHARQSPRDTRTLERLLKHLPGGERMVKLSESAPYLLTLIVATHGAFLGPIDLLIIGGFSVATWLTEKLSNEVTARARRTNRDIQRRFEHLGQEQVEKTRLWLERHAPRPEELVKLEEAAGRIAACVEK